MNKRDCEKVMDAFLGLDKNQRLPLGITVHLLFCPKCRTEIRLCYLAEKKAAEPLAVLLPLNDDTLVELMKKIYPDYTAAPAYKKVTLKRWIFSGILMIAAMIPFNRFTKILLPQESGMSLVFYMFFGCAIAVYCALFVGSNLDFFVKKISSHRPVHTVL